MKALVVFAVALITVVSSAQAGRGDQKVICEGSGWATELEISVVGYPNQKPMIFQFMGVKKNGVHVKSQRPGWIPGDDFTCGTPAWTENVVAFACDRISGRNGWTGSPDGRYQIYGQMEVKFTAGGVIESIGGNTLKITYLSSGKNTILAETVTCTVK